ncbi:MAG: hypothetical protein D8M58_09300 [Calditrichaeota bacterium]|nr:MAG: hypothetical protein DWQ03_17190 [Calditrichota bacterium]MBL1205582.1 hypothetical protein [Calditrichota bacterium]NOG45411.1 hypothetical protein [Calditrichota bacterium]
MLKKTQLFFLIKSMSKAEKRYFKLFVSSTSGDNNYLLLFDEIDNQVEYDEKSIKKKFAGKAFIKQLHVTKNYLSNLILKSLRNYHSKISKEAELKDLQRNVEILLKRELFQQCLFNVEKGILIAEQYEKWPDLLSFLEIKRTILRNKKGTSAALDELNQINKLEQSVLNKLMHTSRYWDLTVNMFSNFSEPEKLESNSLLQNEKLADSFQAKMLYHYAWQAVHFTKNNLQETRKTMEKVIFSWEENEHQIYENPAAYLTALNNLVGIALQAKQYEYAEHMIYKIRRVPIRYGLKSNNPIAVKAMLHSYNVELEMYRDTRQADRGIEVIPKVREFLEDKSLDRPKSYELLLYYQFSSLHYFKENYEEALKYLNIILAGKYANTRDDIMSYAHLSFLVIHFELGNMILLRYAVESCRRFLKKKRDLQDFEKTLLSFFSKLSTVPKAEYKDHFKNLKSGLFAGLSEKEKNNILDYLNFEEWIENNLNK